MLHEPIIHSMLQLLFSDVYCLETRLSIEKNNLNYHRNNIQIEGEKNQGKNHNKPDLTFI